MGKKIRKAVAKFDLGHQFAKKMGLPDPAGDALYGSEKALSPAEQAEKAAKEQSTDTGSTVGATPTAVSDDTMAAREAMRRRQLASAGMGGTMLTGASGLTSANTAGKSLLGS